MLLKKYLSHLSELSDLRLFIVRYLVNFIGFVEIISLPVLLDPSFYTKVELMRQLFIMAPLLILGAHSGYLICLYKERRDLQLSLMIMTVLIGAVISIAISLTVGGLLPAIAIFLMILVASLEKVLVAGGKLIVASVYKAVISGALIGIALYANLMNLDVSALSLYSGCVVVGVLLWGVVIWFTIDLDGLRAQINLRRSISEFLDLARYGFLISLQSYVLVGYFLFDRLIVNSYYSEYSSEYALGFSLSQIIFIAINTISFAAQHKIGVNLDQFSLKMYNQMLLTTLTLLAALLSVALPMIYLFSQIVNGYGEFINTFALVASFFGTYYAISAVAVTGFYRGMTKKALIVSVVFLLLNILVTLGLAENKFGYYENLFKSGLILLSGALVFDQMIRQDFNRKY